MSVTNRQQESSPKPPQGVFSRNLEATMVSKTANVFDGRKSIDAGKGGVRASNDILPSIKELASRSAVKTTAKSQRNNNQYYRSALQTGDMQSSRASSQLNPMSLSTFGVYLTIYRGKLSELEGQC
jgi:hypothetical protein